MSVTSRVETPLLIAFLDLSHFNHESERRDDAAIADTIDAYYGIVSQAIDSADGRVVKFIGDAALAVFPEAAADGGVRALLDLKPKVERFLADRGWDCHLSAKVHFGTAIAGDFGPTSDRRFDVIGRAVNHTAMLRGSEFTLSDEALRRVSDETRRQLDIS
jgi:class 3 adenylate cyclase